MIAVILGMHRSGTSLTSSLVHTMGYRMGPDQDLFRSNNANKHGFWEDRSFSVINRKILKKAGGHWHNPPHRDHILGAGTHFRKEISNLIQARSGLGVDWGWKDPRSCLTIECWMEFLSEAHTRYVWVQRKPAAIADSLIRRGEILGHLPKVPQTQRDGMEALANEHNKRVYNFILRYRLPVHVVRYENLMNQQLVDQELADLAHFLGLEESVCKAAKERIRA